MSDLKFINKLNAILFFLSMSSLALADPFTVTYSDTIDASSTTPPFNVGEALTISIVLDNGGTTTASQTWTSADAVSITYSINDAPNTITTVFSAAALNSNAGDFVTDAGGVLTTVPSSWTAFISSTTSPSVISTNDPDTPIKGFYINGFNWVYQNDANAAAYASNVSNNIIPAFWTNPAEPTVTAVPTMSIWGIGILSGMIGLLGMYNRRRK
ncbi:MAG: hypothetical protein ACI8QT_002264 [Halioglobus sp.]|jgi:hypothetical protein